MSDPIRELLQKIANLDYNQITFGELRNLLSQYRKTAKRLLDKTNNH